jgi:hypothetical protein
MNKKPLPVICRQRVLQKSPKFLDSLPEHTHQLVIPMMTAMVRAVMCSYGFHGIKLGLL